MSDQTYGGSVRMTTGERIALSASEAKAIVESVEREDARRRASIPDEAAALRAMMDAYIRLKDMGWNDAIYCPKDGSIFEVIEVGSTGIFDCYYEGKWPDGYWNTLDGGDVYPSSKAPALFRLKPPPSPYDAALR